MVCQKTGTSGDAEKVVNDMLPASRDEVMEKNDMMIKTVHKEAVEDIMVEFVGLSMQ